MGSLVSNLVDSEVARGSGTARQAGRTMPNEFGFAEKQVGDSRVVVCIPVFNDWKSALLVVERLDLAAPTYGGPVSIVLVDDGSTEPPPDAVSRDLKSIEGVTVLRLRRNVGHQRAIAIGLSFIHSQCPCRMVVVMDGDGEDAPEHVGAMIDRCARNDYGTIVFAQRGRRSEGPVFRTGYWAFKTIHRMLTGFTYDVGNFSVVPFPLLKRLVVVSELWNHYAAGVIHARLPIDKVPLPRSHRLAGRSKMNFTGLVTHGLSAIAVYGDTVGVRVLCLLSALSVLALSGIFAVMGIRFFTDVSIPGWATNAVGMLLIFSTNLGIVAMAFVLLILQARDQSSFLPIRDWEYYVAHREALRLESRQSRAA